MHVIIIIILVIVSADSRLALDGFRSTVKFTETRAYRAVYEKLEQRHHVVILGRPGDGKTTLGFQALHALQDQQNSSPLIPVSQVLEFLPHMPDGEKFAIFLDDFYGIYTVSRDSMPMSLVYQILSVLRKGNFIIMSMRKDIFLQCKLHLPRELFSKDVIVDLSNNDFVLLDDEKQSMLQLIPGMDDDTSKKILNHKRFDSQQIGFPQCVALMKESGSCDIETILNTPLVYITEQLLLLHEHSKEKFLALLLAFINQGKISENDVNNIRSALPNDLDDSSIKSQQIKQTLRSLDATYLRCTESAQYIISHESIMDGIARTLWNELGCQEYFIMFCPERFLTRITCIQPVMQEAHGLARGNSNTFYISDDLYETLFPRLVRLLASELETSVMTVANIELWDDACATTKFIHYIRQNIRSQKVSNGTSLLTYAAMQGRLILVKALVEGTREETEELRSAIQKAAKHGRLDVVNYLLSHSPDLVDIDLVFHAINGKSVDVFDAISSHNLSIDYNAKIESMICTFAHETIHVNIIEEIILSCNIALLQHIIQSEKIDFVEMVSQNPRLVEFAAYSGSVELMQVMLNSGCTMCHHLLWWGICSGSLDMVKYLLEKGCCFNLNENVSCDSHINQVESLHGLNEMHGACFGSNREIVMHLFHTHPHFMEMKDSDGTTPLLVSPWSGSLDIVKYLETKGEITSVNKYGQNILHHAAWSGSVELVDYLSQQCDALDKDSLGRTILHKACNGGNLILVKHLVENHPALLTMRDNKRLTPLHTAGWSDSVELVEYLISQQCDVLDKDSCGRTILHNACDGGKLILVKHLVENYIELLTMRDNEGITPLHTAGWSGSVELVEYLISQQCHVLDKDSCGRTILHNACDGGKLILVKHLVGNYPSLLTLRDNEGLTPLHTAGWSGSVELVEYLITQHCDVLDKDSNGRTILNIACNGGKLTLVKHLVEQYPSLLHMGDNEGLTPLHTAGWSGSVELVEYLITQHCDVLDKDRNGRTILHIACNCGKLTLVKHLVEQYPSLLPMRDKEGLTPLHVAGWSGSVELVVYLISQQSNVNDTDNYGRTILHFAWREGKLILVKHLVDNYPALMTTKDNGGMAPQHYAVYSDSVEMMEYLTKHGDAFDMDYFGRTILHVACQEGKPILVKYLAENCPALLTVADSEGLTPLHIVCGYGTSDLVEFLICCGADPTVKDNAGRTPFDFAVDMDNTNVILFQFY